MSFIAVFDAGKTRLKLSILAGDGTIVFADSAPSRIATSPRGVLDIDRAEAFVCDALRRATVRFAVDHFVAVGHGAASVWLEGGRLAAPVTDYEAEIPAAVSARYERERPPFAETFSPSLPLGLNLGRQIAWTEAMRAGLIKQSVTLLPWPQYWAWRLCGRAASEVSSLGSHTDLWAPKAADWSSLARARGWSERFAPLMRADAVLESAQGSLAREAGLRAGCQIVCGAHDSNAALYAVQSAGVLAGDACLVSTGTWTITMAPNTPLDGLSPERDCLANVSVSGRPVPTCRFMGGVEYARLAANASRTPNATTLTALVASGTMALPSFAEAGGPFASLRGKITGAAPQDDAGRAALAALYYALMLDYELTLVGGTRAVVVEGAAAQDATITGLLAALADAPVYVCGGEAVAIGAARLAQPFDTAAALQLSPVEPLRIPGFEDYKIRWRAGIAARAGAI